MTVSDTPQCLVRTMQQGDIAQVRIEGQVNLTQSPRVRAFGDRWLRHPNRALVLDLRLCTHMDSTFVGTLLFLQRQAAMTGHGKLRLLAPSVECSRLLGEMGVQDVFETTDREEVTQGSWTILDINAGETSQLRGCITDAHRALASTPGLAAEQFLRVVECFRPDEEQPA
jgi:anti-anti-sigma factor